MEVIKVFVYGSLKKNFPNSKYLKTARFIKNISTSDKFTMYDFGYYPAIVFDDSGYLIEGELYEVNNRTLDNLDILEGYPSFYNRKLINLEDGNSAYIYYLNNTSRLSKYNKVKPVKDKLFWDKK